MTQAILRIFPHSKQEFATADDLRSWLVTALKARGGRYLLRSNQGVFLAGLWSFLGMGTR